MYRKLIKLVAVTALLLIGTVSVSASQWYEEYSAVVPSDVRMYDENRPATRLEFCKLLYKLLEAKNAAPEKIPAEFSDTEDEIIGALDSGGFVDGMGDGSFCPYGQITREQSAKLLCRAMDGLGMEDRHIVDESFGDIGDADDWAREYIARVGRNEIMQGNGTGYYTWKDSEGVFHYPEVFRLENSPFEPKADYTVKQSVLTIYRIYERMAEEGSEKESWDLGGGVMLYINDTSLWAKKDGCETICVSGKGFRSVKKKIRNGKESDVTVYEKPKTAVLENGDVIMAAGQCLYNISTGRRILRLERNIRDLSDCFVSCVISYSQYGLGDNYVQCVYGFDGNIFSSLETMDLLRMKDIVRNYDSEGGVHYIYCDKRERTRKYVYSKASSLEPQFVSDYPLELAENSKSLIISKHRIDGDVTSYNVYNLQGECLYENADYINIVSEDTFYAESRGNPGTLELFCGGEKKQTFKGRSIFETDNPLENFLITKTDSGYNLCGKDGTLYEENALIADTLEKDGEIWISCSDENSTRFYNDSSMEKTAQIPQPQCSVCGEYFLGRDADYTVGGIYSRDGELLIDCPGMWCKQLDGYLYIYPNGWTKPLEEQTLDIYDYKTLEHIKHIDGESINIHSGGFVNISEKTICGDWYNVFTDKSMTPDSSGIEDSQSYVKDGRLIMEIKKKDSYEVIVYDKNFEEINRFDNLKSVDDGFGQGWKYVLLDGKIYLPGENAFAFNGASARVKTRYYPSEKTFVGAYNTETGRSDIYESGEDFTYLLTLDGQLSRVLDKYIKMEIADKEYVYYDYSGGLYSEE